MRSEKRCLSCRSLLPADKRWFGLVHRYGNECPRCGARFAFDGSGDIHLIVGKWSTQDPDEAAELARKQGIAWPPRPEKE
jgi:hypothetical protein